MKKLLGFIAIVWIVMSPVYLLAYPTDTAKMNALLKSSVSSEKTAGLLTAAYYQKFLLGNQTQADSLCKKAILDAHLRENQLEMLQSAIVYAKVCLAANSGHRRRGTVL